MHHPNHADHTRHDLTLIAGHAAGDLSDTDRVHADTLLSICDPCADLRRDLVAIAAATRSLPAPSMPARDFRLDAVQAERLRRGSWLRAALRPFSASGSPVRPMAAAFTSLGLAGLLVATVIPSLFSSVAAPGAQPKELQAAQASAGAAEVDLSRGPAVSAEAGPSLVRNGYDSASSKPVAVQAGGKSEDATSAPAAAVGGAATSTTEEPRALDNGAIAAPTVNPLVVGSLGLLLVGLLLFGLRIASRRLR